jgi:hypothetical protein
MFRNRLHASISGALLVGLTAPGAEFAHVAAAATYDNFRLDSGELACPSWWSDFAGDWRA